MKINKVATTSEVMKSTNDVSEHRNKENPESEDDDDDDDDGCMN